MPGVPYDPVPSIAPTEAATPRPNVNAPVGAFGGEVAHAIEGLGAVTTHAGNELFGRAVAIQQLNNETEAREADAKYMIGAGDLHAKFNSLEGQERVKAFPQYTKDLQDLRVKTRNDLSNPMAQKMYDASSLSTMGRSIFNGAGAAATANKEWAHTTVNAQHELLVKGTYDSPDDDSAFRAAISQNHSTSATRAALTPGGASPERVALMQRQGDSTIASNRILGMARNQPYKASQMLEQYKKEGLLFGKDYETVSNKVQSYAQTVGADTVANQVLEKYLQSDGTYSKTAREMQTEAVDTAQKMYPDDPKMESATRSVFDRNYNQRDWTRDRDARVVEQHMADYRTKGVMSVDMLPPDLVKRMSSTQIARYPREANAYRESIDKQTNKADFQRLLGLYNNNNGAFMETNIISQPGLSKENIDYFTKLQRQATANGDPRVTKAMSTLRGAVPATLESLSIYRRDHKSPEDYDRFTGALHEAIQAWQENTGKPPNEKELTKEIFPNLVMQVTDPDRWFGRKSELFKAGLPEGVKELAEKDAGKSLSEEEARQFYLREQFNKLFGAKGKKDQGRVP